MFFLSGETSLGAKATGKKERRIEKGKMINVQKTEDQQGDLQ